MVTVSRSSVVSSAASQPLMSPCAPSLGGQALSSVSQTKTVAPPARQPAKAVWPAPAERTSARVQEPGAHASSGQLPRLHLLPLAAPFELLGPSRPRGSPGTCRVGGTMGGSGHTWPRAIARTGPELRAAQTAPPTCRSTPPTASAWPPQRTWTGAARRCSPGTCAPSAWSAGSSRMHACSLVGSAWWVASSPPAAHAPYAPRRSCSQPRACSSSSCHTGPLAAPQPGAR